MSRTATSPLRASAPACRISRQAWSALMKKLRIRGSVIVMGRPRSSWEAKVCSTEPCDASTLPKRTETKR